MYSTLNNTRVVLKVVRSYNQRYRLGLYIPKSIVTKKITRVEVNGISEKTLKISKITWYNKYKTIEDKIVNEWIISNGWDRLPYTPMQLLLFDLNIIKNKHVLTYVGASKFKKKSNSDKFTVDGDSYNSFPNSYNTDKKIDFLWQNK